METAKVFMKGQSQFVQLPPECRFDVVEVFIGRMGPAVLLASKADAVNLFSKGIIGYTEDSIAEGRNSDHQQEHKPL